MASQSTSMVRTTEIDELCAFTHMSIDQVEDYIRGVSNILTSWKTLVIDKPDRREELLAILGVNRNTWAGIANDLAKRVSLGKKFTPTMLNGDVLESKCLISCFKAIIKIDYDGDLSSSRFHGKDVKMWRQETAARVLFAAVAEYLDSPRGFFSQLLGVPRPYMHQSNKQSAAKTDESHLVSPSTGGGEVIDEDEEPSKRIGRTKRNQLATDDGSEVDLGRGTVASDRPQSGGASLSQRKRRRLDNGSDDDEERDQFEPSFDDGDFRPSLRSKTTKASSASSAPVSLHNTRQSVRQAISRSLTTAQEPNAERNGLKEAQAKKTIAPKDKGAKERTQPSNSDNPLQDRVTALQARFEAIKADLNTLKEGHQKELIFLRNKLQVADANDKRKKAAMETLTKGEHEMMMRMKRAYEEKLASEMDKHAKEVKRLREMNEESEERMRKIKDESQKELKKRDDELKVLRSKQTADPEDEGHILVRTQLPPKPSGHWM